MANARHRHRHQAMESLSLFSPPLEGDTPFDCLSVNLAVPVYANMMAGKTYWGDALCVPEHRGPTSQPALCMTCLAFFWSSTALLPELRRFQDLLLLQSYLTSSHCSFLKPPSGL